MWNNNCERDIIHTLSIRDDEENLAKGKSLTIAREPRERNAKTDYSTGLNFLFIDLDI